jgi:hypothetical protein
LWLAKVTLPIGNGKTVLVKSQGANIKLNLFVSYRHNAFGPIAPCPEKNIRSAFFSHFLRIFT